MTASFADRLNEAMELRGIKQIDFVHAAQDHGIKLGKSHISQYASGKTRPREEIEAFLAAVLGVNVQWLEGYDVPINEHVPSLASYNKSSTTSNIEPLEESVELDESSISVSDTVAASSSPGFNADVQNPSFTDIPSSVNQDNDKGHPMARTFSKSTKLDNVLYDVRGPVVQEAARMEAAGTHVLKLNIGNPAPFGFRTPDEVIYDMAQQLTESEGYSASKGLFSARKAIMQYAQIKGLPNVGIEDIYTGNGVSELINLSMSALLDNGDEVLLPSPDYPLWTACVTLAGGKPVHYVCDEQSDWYPDLEDMRSKITDRTKAIVIINPNNPTGALYPKEVLEEIVQIAREHQLIIFSDEIYDRLVMDGLEHTSIASLAPDLFCVTYSGLSKSHMIAGFRIGWMILSGNKALARDYIEGLDMLTNMRICSNVPAQAIVQTALGGHQSVKDYIVPGGRIYEQREYIYEALNSIPGITAVKPKAAFYIFPKIDTKRFHITDDEQFAVDLLHNEKLLIVQGTGFNWHAPDHFRVVYLPRVEVLKDAVGKMQHFFGYYRQ
ncbi:aminotransferase class I/II-fold pyridoxal phosphate-dependent enzyme [Bifidobacterium cuniculi]|uniref:alanine transaminase n=1 Tax=Bifidobacterium cuniculi TaxID=1688 RepID=A0A087B4Q8_9BIFI|nr:aminotransferase class I/II-fold pyridoxal phosphate-dependent enzyme [Bifidobacterium cuniculi]KFI66008.1 bifunctional HTH-domain containing protein/aminotransferase [Bifidobacterium cuniculi]